MTPFDLVEPASLDEAIALLDPDDPTVRPIAGGTALMLMMKAGVFRPTRLVSLRKLAARYSSVAAGKDGALTIGAMTPLAAVERSPEVAMAARESGASAAGWMSMPPTLPWAAGHQTARRGYEDGVATRKDVPHCVRRIFEPGADHDACHRGEDSPHPGTE